MTQAATGWDSSAKAFVDEESEKRKRDTRLSNGLDAFAREV
jgi:hypothetical protein